MDVARTSNTLFSIMKGIAIISVVIGHCTMSSFTERYVNQYHLAVFFFVSGYFFKEKYIDDKRTFVWKKVKKLYVWFVVSGLMFLLFHPLLEWLHVYNEPMTWNEYGKEIIDLTLRLTSSNPLMGAMWFCPTLLGVSLLAFALFVITKDYCIRKRSAVFALSVVLGGVFLHLFKWKSPYCIWQYLIIVGIYYMGWVFHQYEDKLPVTNKHFRTAAWCGIILIIGSLLVVLTKFGIYGRLQPANINNESVLSIMIIAMIGCGFVYSMAKVISHTCLEQVFALIGEYSFSIMLLHFLGFKAVNFVYCLYYDFPMETIASFPTIEYSNISWFFLYLLAGVFVPILLSESHHTCKRILASSSSRIIIRK